MTKKTFTVIKTVKVDGVELVAGDDVSLEPGQVEALLGTFIEEKRTPKTIIPANIDRLTQDEKGAHRSNAPTTPVIDKGDKGDKGGKGGKGMDGL